MGENITFPHTTYVIVQYHCAVLFMKKLYWLEVQRTSGCAKYYEIICYADFLHILVKNDEELYWTMLNHYGRGMKNSW